MPSVELADSGVGSRIRALREAMSMSLRDLAERSGVSAPMLSQVERGESGTVALVCDGERHVLGQGDCVTFDADLPHHFENPAESDEAVLLAVVSAGLRRS